MRKSLLCALLVFATNSQAEILPSLNSEGADSPHKLFVSSQNNILNEIDSWKIDSGYAYSVFGNIDIYVGTRIDNVSEESTERGFLSGVSYNIGEAFSLKSTLHTKQELQENGEPFNTFGAEVSSRVKISDHLDLHATLDYEELQQGFELGLGFRF